MKKQIGAITIFLFCAILYSFGAAHVLLPDTQISNAERRYLTQLPSLTWDTLTDGTFMKNLDKYLPDQFPLREGFRGTKAVFEKLSLRLDSSDVYESNDHLAALDTNVNDALVEKAANKLGKVKDALLTEGHTAYLAVIPPKNYYISKVDKKHPTIDYEAVRDRVGELCPDFSEIDLYDLLDLDDYYRTDSHWRQERLEEAGVADRIAESMGVLRTEEYIAETSEMLESFRGVYVGQSALPTEAEQIYYMTSPSIENATVTYIGADIAENSVYTLSKTEGVDMYDIFLGGAVPVIEIVNENAATDRELVIFRDSYGSSLAPLLIECFERITLVDLRYIEFDLVPKFVEYENADLLFLYSTGVLCNSEMLKVR